MRILGIDYGTRKIGLALATSKIAEPLRVVRVKSDEEALEKMEIVIYEEQIESIVVGVSEKETGKKSKEFGKRLRERTGLKVEFQDEALTTSDAKDLAMEAGVGQKKRKNFEDAYSATLILQAFLDNN